MKKWLPLLAACLGTLMLLIDVTIVTVALPDIAADLGAGLAGLQWVMDGYALALAALLLVLGSLADRVGAKRAYLAGLVLFAAASLVCGIAQTIPILVTARVFQGIGGAAMFATTLSLLNATYTGRDRGVAFGTWGAVSGAAAGIGTVLGGLLTDVLSWRWIFLVNLPIAVPAVILTALVFAPSVRQRDRALDLPGMLAFATAAIAVTYGIIRGGEEGWGSTVSVTALVVGAAALLVFVLIESRSAAPMLPLGLLRNRFFSAPLIGAMGVSIAAFASTPLLSIWLQQQLRLTPLQAGLAMFPLAAVSFLVAGVFGRALHDAQPKWTIGAGLVVTGAGASLLTIVNAGSSWTAILPGFLVIGAGVGMVSPALVSVALAAVPPQQGGTAAGAVNTARQLGFALGIAVLGTVFHGVAGQSGEPSRFADGLDAIFVVSGAVGIVSGLVTFGLLNRRQPSTNSEPKREVAVPV